MKSVLKTARNQKIDYCILILAVLDFFLFGCILMYSSESSGNGYFQPHLIETVTDRGGTFEIEIYDETFYLHNDVEYKSYTIRRSSNMLLSFRAERYDIVKGDNFVEIIFLHNRHYFKFKFKGFYRRCKI